MSPNPILAYITPQMIGVRIIDCALKLANALGRELIVVTVLPSKTDAATRAGDVKCLKMISDICGVDITVRYSDRAAESLASHITENCPSHIFVGEGCPLLPKIKVICPPVPISVVTNKTVFTVPA
jgi:K+-sensing histidine kinase KdpD